MHKTLRTLAGACLLAFSMSGAAAATPASPAPGTPGTPALPAGPDAAAAEAPALGSGTVTRLPNGLTVLVMEDERFPLVSTRLYVHAGSAYEDPRQAGISHLLEHMVFKGTERRPKGGISQEVEAAGGYLNAATSFDYTVYITDLPDRHWKLGMDTARDMAFHARLDPAELESEKDVVVAELKRGLDSPGNRLFNTLQAATLPGTPYARPIIGFENTIRGISVDDMRAYIKRLYQPQNMLLVVVGKVKSAEVLAEAARQFGDYRNDVDIPQPQPIDALSVFPTTPLVHVQPGPWNKVYLSAALPVPGSGDSQSVPLDMLAQLLGGDQTSLLYKRFVYERRLADSISVGNANFERVGMFLISAELDADKLDAFWTALTKDLAALSADEFSDADIARAKLNMEDEMFRAKETIAGLASKAGMFQFFGKGAQDEVNYVQSIRAVDRGTLQSMIDLWFNPTRLATVALTPQQGTSPDLAAILAANWKTTTTAAAHDAQNAARAQKPEIIDLGSGRTLVLIADPTLPYVAANLRYYGGDALIKPDEQGLASLTARVLSKGTEKRSATEIQAFLGDRASSLGAASGRDVFGLSLDGPARFAPELFGLLGEVLRQPAFAPEEVDRARQSQTAAIRSAEDTPMGLAFRKLPPFLFPHSVYGYDALGTPKDLMRFKADMVRGFWNTQRQQPWVLAVAGDIDREAVIAFAKSLPAPDAKAVRLAPPVWGKDKDLNLALADRKQAHLMLIFETVPVGNPDSAGLSLLEASLGGMGGPLFTQLRDEKGLGYSVSVFHQQNEGTGMMVFYIGTDPERMQEAEKAFRDVIAQNATNLMPEADIERGRNQIEGAYYREQQRLGQRASEAAALTLQGRPLDFTRQQVEAVRHIDAAVLRDLVKKYLKPDSAYVVKVLPQTTK